MDINAQNFYPLILDILTDISEAHFVAFDLELSGVPTKDSLNTQVGKPTLQQRYMETKQAAERYQILQIGLTCVEQDVNGDRYILKPYNFDLSPVVNERLDVERIFSFQSGAVEFLLRNGFDMSRPFNHGVPYLSRAEAQLAREKHTKRQDKAAFADIEIKPTDTESLAFVQRIREEINAWISSPKRDKSDFLNIASVPSNVVSEMQEVDEFPDDLSRFEKRLVHQVVRAEYPELVTVSKRGFVQIVRFNKAREDRITAERKRELDERIGRQKGFRWIFEAMCGSNFEAIDLREIGKHPESGEARAYDAHDLKNQLQRAQSLLRHKPRILVGHNCFLDMVYIYRTFFGDLPNTVEEFQRRVHELWPTVIDTKYMSTHNCGSINPVSSLEQIAWQLSNEPKPAVQTDSKHEKYAKCAAFHEAGYDSYLTAQVAVRLSAKLTNQENAYGDTRDGVASMSLDSTTTSQVPHVSDGSELEDGWQTVVSGKTFKPSLSGVDWEAKQRSTKKQRYTIPDVTLPSGDGMPKLSSEFWKVYGNKLRVFGTQEGVCLLDGPADEAASIQAETSDGGVAV